MVKTVAKMPKSVVGDVVAFNRLPDAAWFDVVSVDGFRMIVKEHSPEGIDYVDQRSDTSLVKQIRAQDGSITRLRGRD